MKSNRYKILVVEDEPNINEFVCLLSIRINIISLRYLF